MKDDMPVLPFGNWRDFVWVMHRRGFGISWNDIPETRGTHVSVRKDMGCGIYRSVWSDDNGASVTGTIVDLNAVGQQSSPRWLETNEWYSFLGASERYDDPEEHEYKEYLRLKMKFENR